MKKIKRWFKDIFNPEDFNGMDIDGIRQAFNDVSVRTLWLSGCFDEIKRINREVDKRLLSGTDLRLIDLCARRQAYQDVLESVLSARRQITKEPQDLRHNPLPGVPDLDRVTA